MKRDIKGIVLRVIIYILGLGILALGVVLNIKTKYGVSPVSSLPYAISEIFGVEFGNATILCYSLFILIEVIIMKRNNRFSPIIFLQLPFGIIFGKFTTLFNHFMVIDTASHVQRVIMLLFAILFTAIGVVITVNMNIILLPPDGLTNEIAKLVNKDLGNTKIYFDSLSVLATITLSVAFRHTIIGIGIGTIICAVFIGKTIRMLNVFRFDRLLRFIIKSPQLEPQQQ